MNEPPSKQRRTRWGQTAADVAVEKSPEDHSEITGRGAAGGGLFRGGNLVPSAADVAPPPVPFDVTAAAARARDAVEKAKKAAIFQKQIAERLAMLNASGHVPGLAGLQMAAANVPKPRPLRLDRFGRELDEEGRVVPLKPLVLATLKVNINREKDEKLKKVLQPQVDRHLTDPRTNQFYDEMLAMRNKSRMQTRQKGLRFVEPGYYVTRERQMQRKAEAKALGIDLASLRREKMRAARRDEQRTAAMTKETEEEGDLDVNQIPLGSIEEVSFSSRAGRHKRTTKDAIPEIESWDIAILAGKTDVTVSTGIEVGTDFPFVVNPAKISHLVEHPIATTPAFEGNTATSLFLTKEERRKLRRRKRQEKEKEKQDKIRMGLMPPPPPKLKLSNLMRVLGDQQVADPSRTEKEARNQMQRRIQEHEARNQARKLNPEDRTKKKIAKWQPGQGNQIHIAAFWIKSLNDKRHLFKVDRNAQQLHLSGVGLIVPEVLNLVVVEGGARAVKIYKKLLLRRIPWEEADEGDEVPEVDDDELEAEETRKAAKRRKCCILVWEGISTERSFKTWKMHVAKTYGEGRQLLSTKQTEHVWDLVKNINTNADLPRPIFSSDEEDAAEDLASDIKMELTDANADAKMECEAAVECEAAMECETVEAEAEKTKGEDEIQMEIERETEKDDATVEQ